MAPRLLDLFSLGNIEMLGIVSGNKAIGLYVSLPFVWFITGMDSPRCGLGNRRKISMNFHVFICLTLPSIFGPIW